MGADGFGADGFGADGRKSEIHAGISTPLCRAFKIYHTRIESRNAGMVNLIPFIVEHNAQGEGLQAAPDLC